MTPYLRRGLAAIGLVLLAASLSGCIVEERPGGGGGWCYWHPGRCWR